MRVHRNDFLHGLANPRLGKKRPLSPRLYGLGYGYRLHPPHSRSHLRENGALMLTLACIVFVFTFLAFVAGFVICLHLERGDE